VFSVFGCRFTQTRASLSCMEQARRQFCRRTSRRFSSTET